MLVFERGIEFGRNLGVEKPKLTVNASKREEVPSARERASSLGSRKTPLEHCIKSASKAGDAFIMV